MFRTHSDAYTYIYIFSGTSWIYSSNNVYGMRGIHSLKSKGLLYQNILFWLC